MHQCVTHTKVIAILLLMYPHVLEYGCYHFVARQLAVLFKAVSTSTPSNPSTETMKGENCWHLWRKASRYILLPPFLHHEYTSPVSLSCKIFVSVQDTHVVNTVCPFLSEVMDQKFTLLLLLIHRAPRMKNSARHSLYLEYWSRS